jgi:hypothetical protein
MSDEQERVENAGAGTDQYPDNTPETGDFITDRAPRADTPASGSSNAGVNATHANRTDDDPESDADVTG